MINPYEDLWSPSLIEDDTEAQETIQKQNKTTSKWTWFRKKKKPEPVQGKYEGEYLDGLYHGKGKFVYTNGDVIDGDFAFGKPEGEVILHINNGPHKGSIYKGQWKDGKQHGLG